MVTDVLHCQKKTAKEILGAGADYVFSVKKNQKELYNDVAEMIDFKQTDKYELLHAPLEKVTKSERSHGRTDKRTAMPLWHMKSIGCKHSVSGMEYRGQSRKLCK